MQQSYTDIYGKYLAHKGVKGMKWGKKVTPKDVKDVTESQKEFLFKTPGNIDPKITKARQDTADAIWKINWENDIKTQGYPDDYVKTMDSLLKKVIKAGRVGYQDDKGKFFEGPDKKSVYKQKFESAMAQAKYNEDKAYAEFKNKKK